MNQDLEFNTHHQAPLRGRPSNSSVRPAAVAEQSRHGFAGPRARRPIGSRLLNLDQFNIKHEHPLRLVLTPVGELFRYSQPTRLASDHQLQAFRPPGDDLIQRER
jgi:hypothetical protein